MATKIKHNAVPAPTTATRNEKKRDRHASSRTEYRLASASYRNRSIHGMTDDEFASFDDSPTIERMR